MLKRFWGVIMMLMLLLVSCKNETNNLDPSDTAIESEYSTNMEGSTVIQDYVDNAATAQSIGDAVIKSIVGEDKFSQLIGVEVSYDEKNQVWLVNRNLGPDTLGGDYTCAVQKSNGQVLKVWAGE